MMILLGIIYSKIAEFLRNVIPPLDCGHIANLICCLIASVFVAATYLAEDVPKGSLFKHN